MMWVDYFLPPLGAPTAPPSPFAFAMVMPFLLVACLDDELFSSIYILTGISQLTIRKRERARAQ